MTCLSSSVPVPSSSNHGISLLGRPGKLSLGHHPRNCGNKAWPSNPPSPRLTSKPWPLDITTSQINPTFAPTSAGIRPRSAAVHPHIQSVPARTQNRLEIFGSAASGRPYISHATRSLPNHVGCFMASLEMRMLLSVLNHRIKVAMAHPLSTTWLRVKAPSLSARTRKSRAKTILLVVGMAWCSAAHLRLGSGMTGRDVESWLRMLNSSVYK